MSKPQDKQFFIDPNRCIGCKACVQACSECDTHKGHSMIHLEYVDRGASVAGLKGRPAERPLNDSLRVSWVQWRGRGVATFDPRVIRVVDGKATTKITFDKPGNYVLRAYAEDASIHTPHDVSVVVRPPQ